MASKAIINTCIIILTFAIIIHNTEGREHFEIANNQNRVINPVGDYILQRRNKRDIDVTQDGSSYAVNANKNIFDNDKHKLEASAGVSGSKSGTVDNAEANLDYSNAKGHKVSLSAQRSADFGKLSAEGNVKLLNTDQHSLDGSGFANKEWTSGSRALTNYGGQIDYLNKNGNSGSLGASHDDSFGEKVFAKGKVNLLDTDTHHLDAKGHWTRYMPNDPFKSNYDAYGGELDYNHRKGSASLSAQHIPNFGDEISARGGVNLFHNQNHNVDAQGEFKRTFPMNPSLHNYNTYGGNLDYLYKDKVGANLGFKHSDIFDKTDYSAMGRFNIFKVRDSSLDLSAGLTKSVSPFTNDNWKPNIMLGFSKRF